MTRRLFFQTLAGVLAVFGVTQKTTPAPSTTLYGGYAGPGKTWRMHPAQERFFNQPLDVKMRLYSGGRPMSGFYRFDAQAILDASRARAEARRKTLAGQFYPASRFRSDG